MSAASKRVLGISSPGRRRATPTISSTSARRPSASTTRTPTLPVAPTTTTRMGRVLPGDRQRHEPMSTDVAHLRLAELLDRERRRGVAVQEHRWVLVLDVVAQRLQADVGGVVRVVVDAERRAVGEHDVDMAEALQQLRGLLLAPHEP